MKLSVALVSSMRRAGGHSALSLSQAGTVKRYICYVPSSNNQMLKVHSSALSGVQNGVKISPIGFKNTLLLTLTSVNIFFPRLLHFTEQRAKILRLLDPDIK